MRRACSGERDQELCKGRGLALRGLYDPSEFTPAKLGVAPSPEFGEQLLHEP